MISKEFNKLSSLLISNIQRFSIHDGPGIRTVIFLSGCNLKCKWCHNPELQDKKINLEFSSDKCSPLCSRPCLKACKNNSLESSFSLGGDPSKAKKPSGSPLPALSYRRREDKKQDENNQCASAPWVELDRDSCKLCMSCVDACPYQALRAIGYQITSEKLLQEILKDKNYFDSTKGGVTLSGGEPLLQAEAVAEFLRISHNAGIHTMVETAGNVNWDAFELVLPYVDKFFFDIKVVGDEFHQELTGVKTQIIHQNIEKLLKKGVDVSFRMVIVPEYNNKNLMEVAKFLQSFNINTFTLLKYQSLGESKLKNIENKHKQKALNITDQDSINAIESADKFFRYLGFEIIRYDNKNRHERKTFTARVLRLREAVRTTPFSICIERSNLLTDYMKRSKAKSKEIIRAEGLNYVMRNRSCKINTDELLVGNFTKNRVGGHLYMDYHGLSFIGEMFTIDKRKVNPLQISWSDKLTYYTKLLPYWLFRNSNVKCNGPWQFLKFTYGQFFGNSYVTPLVASVAHFVPNFKKLLTLGTDGIIEEAR
ncbi:MAG: glycyl-radical enzyme activating protein, partial [Oligoflexia bacterium]|nr:glycyl-radical enzyme activating protein [Oligoflexia bacterium]